MKIKKFISLLLTLLIITLCFVPAFSANNEVTNYYADDSDEPFQDEYDNNLNKLHFYCVDNNVSTAKARTMSISSYEDEDLNEYLYIDDENELDDAVDAMIDYADNEKITLTVEFKSNYEKTPEYQSFLQERESVETVEDLRAFRERMVAFSKTYHESVVEENIGKLSDFDYESVDTIGYSPFARVEIDKDDLTTDNLIDLANDNSVVNVSMSLEDEVADESSTDWNQVMREIGAYSVIKNSTYTGEGIKIGVLEAAVCDTTHSNFSNTSITIEPGYNNDTLTGNATDIADNIAHANEVTTIITKMAPEAEIYASRNTSNGVAWFISQGCDIVNCSYGLIDTELTNGVYEFVLDKAVYRYYHDGIFDYQIKANMIIVVNSAGNVINDNTDLRYNPDGYITSPGLAHNVITVGGLSCSLGFFDYDLEHNSSSCYVTSTERTKPEVSALFAVEIPGFGVCTGTSFAAPQVTGAAALIMCKYAKSALKPYAIKAMLIAGAEETENFSNMSGSYFDNKVGAGCINLTNMRNSECVTYMGSTDSESLVNNFVYSYNITLKKRDVLQASVCWFADVSSFGIICKISNFDLLLYDSSNNLVCSSSLGNFTNSEFIRYKATSAGTYTVRVYQNGTLPDGITDEPFVLVCNVL